MEQDTAGKPSLPIQWAFVVQFRTGTDVERGRFAGQVEYVVSGQATPFHSLKELLAFMARVLRAGRAQPLNDSSGREARGGRLDRVGPGKEAVSREGRRASATPAPHRRGPRS